ncbi:hypothetical protein H4R34_005240 [Dimargaris verticillata]|uniref:Pentacotripeptide-repeat region of PRORP domain-containing protein n=1 Tax=Dimargaris verticillata TaxID=2761393 RepID=A0A9W8AXE0_9FUNG|nr:hypothetical protein H4R34_005240 [Dimargaris verticillata]
MRRVPCQALVRFVLTPRPGASGSVRTFETDTPLPPPPPGSSADASSTQPPTQRAIPSWRNLDPTELDTSAYADRKPVQTLDRVVKSVYPLEVVWSCYETLRSGRHLKLLESTDFFRVAHRILNEAALQRHYQRGDPISYSNFPMHLERLSAYQRDILSQVCHDWIKTRKPLQLLAQRSESLSKSQRDTVRPWAQLIADCYAQLGDDTKALKILDQLSKKGIQPSLRVCNSLATLYHSQNAYDKFMLLMERLILYRMQSSLYIYRLGLSTFFKNNRYHEAERFFEYICLLEENPPSFVYISLFSTLAKAKQKASAYRILQLIEGRNLDLSLPEGNYLLRALAQLGAFEKLLQYYNSMCAAGFIPSIHTLDAMVVAYLRAERPDKARFLYDEVQRFQLIPDSYLLGNLLRMFAQLKDTAMTENLVHTVMTNATYADVNVYNNAIYALGHIDRCKEALSLVRQMIHQGPAPNVFTYSIAMEVGLLAPRPVLRELMELAQTSDLPWDEHMATALMKGHMCLGEVREAQQVFDRMVQSEIIPRISSFTVMIAGYSRHQHLDDALALIARLPDYNLQPTAAIYRHVVMGAILSRNYPMVQEMIGRMTRAGFIMGTTFYAKVISAFLNTDANELALATVQECLQRRITFDRNLYTACITTFFRTRQFDRAIQYMDQFVQDGHHIPAQLATGFLRSCAQPDDKQHIEHVQRALEQGQISRPDRLLYNAFIKAYRATEQPDKAFGVWDTICHQQLKPDHTTLICLFETCAYYPEYGSRIPNLLAEAQGMGLQLNSPSAASLIKTYCVLRDGVNATLLLAESTKAKILTPSRKLMMSVYIVTLIQKDAASRENMERWLSSYYTTLFPEMARLNQLPNEELESTLELLLTSVHKDDAEDVV